MANQFLFANFFATELTAAVTVSDTVLNIPPSASMALQNFTSGFYAPLTLWDGQNPPEIVWCTANPQTGQLTVLRAQEGTSAFAWAAGTQVISSLTAAVINAALLAYNTGLVLVANYLPLSGGTLTGPLTLSGDPVTNLQAATKQYVDSAGGTFMPISGGVFTGDVSMNGHRLLALPLPATGGEPATKAYADVIQANANSYAQDVSGIYLTAGTGSAYTLTPGKYGGGLTDGLKLAFRLHATNRAAPTLAVDGTAAVPLRWQSGANANPGLWAVGQIFEAEYHAAGPEWIMIGGTQLAETTLTAGGTTTYTLTSGLGIVTLEDGLQLSIQINAGNTGAMTLNVDGLGAVPLRSATGVDFGAGQVKQYASFLIRYNNATGEWLTLDESIGRLDQCADVAITSPAIGQSLGYNGTKWINQRNSPRGYIDGLVLANDIGTPNTVIDVSTGLCRDDTDTVDIQLSTFTKSIGANWAIGSGSGGLDAGGVANTTWYAVYAIYNPSTLASDVLFSTSFSAPTLPSGFTKKRYIGAILTDGSAHIQPFVQLGDEFLLKTGLGLTSGTITTTALLFTVTGNAAVSVGAPPLKWGLRLRIHTGAIGLALLFTSPDESDQAAVLPSGGSGHSNVNSANLGGSGNATVGQELLIRCDTSGQIRGRASSGSQTVRVVFFGWFDQRGRNA